VSGAEERVGIADQAGRYPVESSTEVFHGRVWDVLTQTVRLPSGELVVRDIVEHPSAVAVLALDDDDRMLVVHQYRHAAAATLWELPAGLLDVTGEDPRVAAGRELWEETHHVADEWSVLVDFLSSPGFCDEALRVYLARGVRAAEGAAHDRHGEERDMPVAWVPLDAVVAGVLRGDLHNPTLVVGALAAAAARATGWTSLREADAPWPFGPRALRDAGDTR
jgi:8-oxo-dGDP phosphatase